MPLRCLYLAEAWLVIHFGTRRSGRIVGLDGLRIRVRTALKSTVVLESRAPFWGKKILCSFPSALFSALSGHLIWTKTDVGRPTRSRRLSPPSARSGPAEPGVPQRSD